jgi:hypothetical protein
MDVYEIKGMEGQGQALNGAAAAAEWVCHKEPQHRVMRGTYETPPAIKICDRANCASTLKTDEDAAAAPRPAKQWIGRSLELNKNASSPGTNVLGDRV